MTDPLEEIVAERERAREKDDPNTRVCFLATVTAEGHPTVRTLVLRDIHPQGIELLISSASPKWRQLQSSNSYELLLFWPTIMRQYRIRGVIEPMEEEAIQRYWDRKSLGSRLLELYYPTFEAQSTSVPSREHMLRGIESLRKRYPEAEEVPRPDTLKGIYLVPHSVETWHGGKDRLHDRRLYTRTDKGWMEKVLVP
ncbi:MAG: pyridoxine 5'-phosphate oxidase C-terminal domain-containing protein [Dehalococcoidia bacterium]